MYTCLSFHVISFYTYILFLELTGEVHVGKIGNGKEVKAKSACAFNPANPLDNYFYAEINTLTLLAISQAFEFDIELPKAMLESGFPEGLVASFSTNPKGIYF